MAEPDQLSDLISDHFSKADESAHLLLGHTLALSVACKMLFEDAPKGWTTELHNRVDAAVEKVQMSKKQMSKKHKDVLSDGVHQCLKAMGVVPW